MKHGWAVMAVLAFVPELVAQAPFGKVIDDVNTKMVKLYGAGGFRGVASYGTGILVSPDGHILTCASAMLDTLNLRAHLADGRRFEGLKIIVIEPELDLALIKIDQKLIIPASRETAGRPSGRSRTAAGSKVPSSYVVKRGDGDLYAICRKFYGAAGEGARVARIMDMNGLWSAEVATGTRLTLPPK